MSWPIVELQEVCKTGSGTTPPRKRSELYEGSIPWVKSGELRESEIFETEECVSEQALNTTSLKLVPAGALLVAMYGATVGRVGLLGIDATTNQAVCHIIPNPKKVDRRYMFHLLQSRAQELAGRGVGGAQPNISQGTIKQLKIPLPPLDDQKRIAAILDQADKLRRLRQTAITKLNTLRQSIFYEMFGAFRDDFSDWPVHRLDTLVTDAQIGAVRAAKEMGDDKPVEYVRMDSIDMAGGLSFERLKRVDASEADRRKYGLLVGDFLFNTRNSKELVGKTAVVRAPFDGIYNNNILRLRFSDTMTADFLDAFLRTRKGQTVLSAIKSGTTSVFAIYQKSFTALDVPVPPKDLQLQYSERLRELFVVQKKNARVYMHASSLFASLQHRAFRGEL